jgi:crotonobetainyl-CoA:carnitine CoA-transferase CaiB-like acyl-CoA transferase
MGREDFVAHQYDGAKRDEIFAHFRQQFLSRPRDEWFEILTKTDICAAPIYSLDEALQDAHNIARKMIVDVDAGGELGTIKQVGIGTKLSETPGEIRSVGPVAGQDTDAVLGGLGLDAAAIAALRERGAVA